MALASMWAVLELQPGVTMGSLECRVAPQLSVVRQPCSILSCPNSLATTPLSCFQLTLSMGMASLGPAGLKRRVGSFLSLSFMCSQLLDGGHAGSDLL